MTKRTFHIQFGTSADHSLDYLLGMLADVRVTTVQTLQHLSVQELDWQYKEGWNTIGALLAHITALEHYFRIEFVEGRKLTEAETQHWEPALDMGTYLPQLITGQPWDAYQAGLTASRQLLLQALQNLTFKDFTKRLEGYDADTGCNLAWVLFHMLEDEIYHRGQISIIRKLYKEHQG
ncbi:DinB family protein [Hymenobacter sp. GOD-10R]|uniref:DinB family protein n=1 Tax=Hymenobacter sp. GOD-10R TaxID=3093922 RepID=UPI002D76F789|nr:DinB family protein [Hymenobacter sp. GOD-10R]WRQ31082.1 DinB family protein [Hymenobacter sp. GOD-10R]